MLGAKNLSRQPYMPGAQFAGSTSVAFAVPVFADPLTTEGEEKLKMADLQMMFHSLIRSIRAKSTKNSKVSPIGEISLRKAKRPRKGAGDD